MGNKKSIANILTKMGLVILLLSSVSVQARTFELTNQSFCKIENELNSIRCSDRPSENSPIKLLIKNENEKWIAAEVLEEKLFELELLKEDDNVIILNYPVFYSGHATITLFKKTGNFFISEKYFSEGFNRQGISIDYGHFSIIGY
jgi:hypothetical protein